MRNECRERFPHHRLETKPLISDSGMHHGTHVTHVPRCMSGSLTRGGGGNVPGIPGVCATLNFTYLSIGPWHRFIWHCRPFAWESTMTSWFPAQMPIMCGLKCSQSKQTNEQIIKLSVILDAMKLLPRRCNDYFLKIITKSNKHWVEITVRSIYLVPHFYLISTVCHKFSFRKFGS